MDVVTIGEWLTLWVMSFALGMDAFSIGLGMGMLRLRMKQIIKIGVVIGLFHMGMPLGGLMLGKQISSHFGGIAAIIGGCLLLLLGFQMIRSSFKPENEPFVTPVGFGLLLFALSASLDSFSVGLSLGIYGAKIVLTIFMFGLMSMLLTWCGLMMGRKVQNWLGSYSEALGGLILLAFGIKLLFPL
ncbi:manganese efflux pump MntP family protein [Fictibacillus enclensis]|uniref:manganese efflux pump MntP n=1 Tax=Fictibacillus enclensis TaxID=1017270 RepID=UPI0024C00DD8|nr:manganese efflux pump MntP family protein [Fictibacillus enclensis]MDM5340810.1 manganese efflux pump MntP family protein [Fictibacillus enclensis]WHY72232.1 manganese efflux pump MntP family protein [Fictibacillus enclensis]